MRRRHIKTWSRYVAAMGICTVLSTTGLPGFGTMGQIETFAYGPKTPSEESADTTKSAEDEYLAEDGNQISHEKLQDGKVEYEELGTLIHYNNTDVQLMAVENERSRADYKSIKDYLVTERASASMEKKDAKSEGDMETYAENVAYEKVYSSAITSYNNMIRRLKHNTANTNRIWLERQLTSGAQSLMISYQALQSQKETLLQMDALYGQLYEETLAGNGAGTATAQEVEKVRNQWNDVKISLQSMTDNETSVYQNLCLLLGMSEEEGIQIEKIQEFPISLLDQINLEEDTRKAIANNKTFINTRSTSTNKSSIAVKNKEMKMADQEEKIKVVMQELYGKLQQEKLSYESAKVGYSSSELTWNQAQTSYELGIMSKSQYLSAQVAFLQSKATLESEDLNLRQAYETYEWAVKGIADLDF